jgi:hypothetical protein
MPYPLANASCPSRTTPTAHPGDDVELYGAKMESTHRFAESTGVNRAAGADPACAPAAAPPTTSATITPTKVRRTKLTEVPPISAALFNPSMVRKGCPAED